MKFPRSTLIALAFATFQIGACADAELVGPAVTPPRPASEMAQLNYFVGTWKCAGTDMASAVGPEYRIERVITATKDLDGFWLTMYWEEQRTVENPHPWNVETLMTYDANAHAFRYIFRDNYGLWSMGTTPGWEGNRLVIVGDYMVEGQKLPYRDVYTRLGERSFEFLTDTMRNGQWSVDAAAKCRK